jgi:copper(I)-binding protein
MIRRNALALVVAWGIAACGASEPISVTHAWVRLPAPGLSVAAGYFDIVNRTTTPIELVGARSDVARSIEMHTESHAGRNDADAPTRKASCWRRNKSCRSAPAALI